MSKTGRLICPKCKSIGMSNYEIWEMIQINNFQKSYIFYNIKKERRGWKCWSLLIYCGYKNIYKCWDPCGCFRDYCTSDNCSNDDSTCLCFIKFCLAIVLFELIFIFYFFFCIWFDIYNAFFIKDEYRIVCIGNSSIKIPEKENIWGNNRMYQFIDIYWICNHQYLFKCFKCDYTSESFMDFIENDEVIVDVNNTNNNSTTNEINTTAGDINPKGEEITVLFAISDPQKKISIQSNSKALFSQVINNLYSKIPEFKNKNFIFLYKNKMMEPSYTMEQNNYKSGEQISIFRSI